jgi:hypothetical protein
MKKTEAKKSPATVPLNSVFLVFAWFSIFTEVDFSSPYWDFSFVGMLFSAHRWDFPTFSPMFLS